MKKFLLVFFLIFSLSKSKAQVTYHFPHQNAEWGQFEGMWGNGFNGGTVFYFVDGDTSLNSNNYIKINRKAFWSLTDTFISRYTYLREDSTGKVFVFDGTEKLLYDMNSSVGDTIHVYSFFDLNSFSDVIVDSISSIQLGNETRKIFYLSTIYFNIGGGGGNNNSDPLIWIEGIGSNAGIFFPAGGVAVDEVFWLTCFTENDTFRSNQIREGLISREVALIKIEEENQPRWESIQWYCNTIGIDWENAIKIINNIKTLY